MQNGISALRITNSRLYIIRFYQKSYIRIFKYEEQEMAKKYYVVWKGRETGIFSEWDICKKMIDRFAGAKYKSFKTLAQAEAAFSGRELTSIKKEHRPTAAAQTIKSYCAAEIAAMPIEVKIFTDGGCEPNPGEAGSGIALYRNEQLTELWYGLYNADGTNNSAELNALNQALQMAQLEIRGGRSVAVFCDSKYSIQCITRWAVNWEKNGWKKPRGEIKNMQLIKEIFKLYRAMKNKLEIFHVNAHIGIEGNELADRMSILAIESRENNFILYHQEPDVQAILSLRGG